MARVLLVFPNRNRHGLTPIGLTLAATILRQRGHAVRLFDTTFIDTAGLFAPAGEAVYTEKMEQLLFFRPVDLAAHGVVQEPADAVARLRAVVAEFRPQLIVFSFWSCQLTGEDEGMMYWRGRELLRRAGLAGRPGGARVVAGGIYPSLNPAAVLGDGVCDLVCRGEGELVYADIADGLDRGGELAAIPNLAFIRAGNLVCNPLRPLAALDDLPAGDFSIYDDRSFLRPFHGRVVRGVDYEFTRGCVNNCRYCVGPELQALYPGQSYRREKSVPRIISETAALKARWRLDILRLQDELFLGMAADKLQQLAREYRDRVGLPFIIETSVATLTPENIGVLQAMGCLSVSVGIEHGDEEFRRVVLNKHYRNSEALRAFRALRAAGIGTHAYTMLGFPGETPALAQETVRLVHNLQPDTFQVSIFQPFYGTPLWRHCVERGLAAPDAPPQEFVRGPQFDLPEFPRAAQAELFRDFSLLALLPPWAGPLVGAARTWPWLRRRLLAYGQWQLARRGRALERQRSVS